MPGRVAVRISETVSEKASCAAWRTRVVHGRDLSPSEFQAPFPSWPECLSVVP